jgi:hypothetical protein
MSTGGKQRQPKKSSSHSVGSGAGGFISFSDVAASGGQSAFPPGSPLASGSDTPTPTSTSAADAGTAIYSGTHAGIALLVRKVLKKDPTTRLRALRELKTILQVSYTHIYIDIDK